MELFLAATIQGIAYGAMGMGIYLSLRIFQIPDITTDGSFTLGAAVTAVMLQSQIHWLPTLLIVTIVGALAGTLTGTIHTRLHLQPLLAGILVMTALYSVNLSIMGRSNVPVPAAHTVYEAVSILPEPSYNRLLVVLVIVTGLLILLNWLLHTDYGIAMRATGCNDLMARGQGVNTIAVKTTGLAIANALTAISGFLICQYQLFADINMGIGIVLFGLGSVIVGEAFLRLMPQPRLNWELVAVLIGCIIFRVVIGLALLAGIHPNWLKAIIALLVLTITALPVIHKRMQKNRHMLT